MPRRNGGSIFCERPAGAVEHDPGAHLHGAHRQARSAARASVSHAAHTCARKSVARGRLLVDRLGAVRAVVADRRGADQHTAGGRSGVQLAQTLARGCAYPRRGCRGSRAWPARSSAARPARRRDARPRRARPAPVRAPALTAGPSAAPATSAPSFARARPGSRESTVTSSPRSLSAATSPGPISPVAPVTATAIAACRRAWYRTQIDATSASLS